MLHPLDDFPVHQTATPLLHNASDSANAYDRFFFNGWHPDGDVFFAVAFGVYPNRGVMDGAFSVVRDRVQHNVRASRACPDDRTDTTAEPISVIVEEPMRRHRIMVTDRFGLSADLRYTAMSPAIEEPRFVHTVGAQTVFDYTRLTQFGRWDGWIDLDGERIEVDANHVGVRDRSWGYRPVGERAGRAAANPMARPPQFFWIWCPTVFDDVCTHAALNHDAAGRPWHESGAVVPHLGADDPPIDPGRVQRATSADAEISWLAGTRWADHLTMHLGMWSGDPVDVTYEPLVRFQMSGIGYRHPDWNHGVWRGEADATRDSFVTDDVDPAAPEFIHIQALSKATWGRRTGMGVVEQLVIGPHEPTGLTGIVDGARA
jgi:hypothetical protein